MANIFEGFQKLTKTQLDSAALTSQSAVKGLQAIAAELTDYSKKSLESGSAFVEKLLRVKTPEAGAQLHLEFVKSSYADFVAQATKVGELYSSLAKEVFKPVRTANTDLKGINA
jgi:hypothetical protein